ncbi:MAG TPA: hypothetical protein VMG12_23390, partial [Polyangiaceae bacterium]|nr:hypothetical protein [Polyangiaceae bacterium]
MGKPPRLSAPPPLRCAVATLALAIGLCALPKVCLASDLSWAGPADCNQREQLLFQVERALGAPLSEVEAFEFQVHVERTSPDAMARLLVQTSPGAHASERVLVAPDCSKLVSTVAVAMALAVAAADPPPAAEASHDPVRPELSSAQHATPEPSPPSAAEVDAAANAMEEEAGADSTVWRAAIWLTGDSGSLPAPGLGAAFGVELGWRRIQLRALATLWFEQHATLAAQSELGGDLSLATGALLACSNVLGTSPPVLSLSLCAGAELGRLSGSGTGVAVRRNGYSPWAAARVESDLYWQVPSSSLRLGAQLSLGVPFVRDDFVLDEIGAVHRPASLV